MSERLTKVIVFLNEQAMGVAESFQQHLAAMQQQHEAALAELREANERQARILDAQAEVIHSKDEIIEAQRQALRQHERDVAVLAESEGGEP